MANADRTRKLLVRTFLVTGSTVATIIGAQTLVALDERTFANTADVNADTALVDSSAQTITNAAPEITINRAAPSIVILRQGQQTPQVVASAPTVQLQQQPQISAPQPQLNTQQQLTLQQLLSMRSRSTR
ncbi:MAG: hypothetical protein KC547_10610 [Anaerolineae bacterium]|nr:hypothetical protein [Anaerolineae bacterium]MCA9908221.1 hypothetical protein [Anaerolineae bacterium]